MPTRTRESSEEDSASSSPSASPSPSQATPSSARHSLAVRSRNGTREVSGSKRKRADTTNGDTSRHQRQATERIRDDTSNDSRQEDDGEDVYDPDQSAQERREVQKGFRDLLRDVTENTEEYLQSGSRGLHETILKADELAKKVRQTTEATIDSRLLVTTTDLSYRKTLHLAQGSLSQGLDVDAFVSKCITYMRQGRGIADDDAAELSSTQRVRRAPQRRTGDEDENDEDDGDMMNWPHLGRFACMPFIRRPAVPGFLFGPLSVEKKARKVTRRAAPFRPNNLTETRPEVLNVEDLAKRENDLTAICGQILSQLRQVQVDAQEAVANLIDDDMDAEEQTSLMHKYGLRSTGGIDLMRFVVNPRSFGQTVENLFYVSFLVRDARVQIELDDHEIPSLAPVDRDEDEETAITTHRKAKYQAILSMDMATWQDIVQTFKLKEPMIEHRKEGTNSGPGARGWYS